MWLVLANSFEIERSLSISLLKCMKNEISLISVSVGDLPRSSFPFCAIHISILICFVEILSQVCDSNSRNTIIVWTLIN